jgi:DNA-directed RNA polymerase subunit RPC12/RpoP
MNVECGSCRHRWFADLGLPAPLLEAVKRINRLRCPMCETPSDRIFISPKPKDEPMTEIVDEPVSRDLEPMSEP